MTTIPPNLHSHLNAFNFHTGRPRFHFDEPPPAAPPPAAPPPAAPPPSAWHAGIDAEFIGHAQNKGWKLDDPKEAFVAATKQARELERHFGVPPERLVKLPAPDAKPEDIRAYYERIGAPKEAKDYDLTAIKDQAIADTLRATLHNSGVPKDAAVAVAKSVATALESKASQQTTEATAKIDEQRAKLKESWGPSFAYNKMKAMDGARKLGMTPEAVAGLENAIGYAGVMETLRQIGANTTEHTFIDRGIGTNGEVTTKEGAIARKQELMADKAWSDRFLHGGVAEKREMEKLDKMVSGYVS